jgi:NAD(P)-dependent dehydrogenase (short-subunit alcohol dehydrogenase family)
VSYGVEGKVALVTGAASGIGRATALAMAEAGARVIAADLNEAGCAELADSHPAVEAVRLDVTDDASFAEAVDGAAARHGRIDILFNNAGAGGTPAPIAEMNMAAWDATMALLLRSVALGTRLAVPHMMKAGGGAIVNTASVAAFGAGYGPIAYSVAKAGVLHMTKISAAELARHNIRVNAVCPGLILTGIFTASYAEQAPELAAEVREYMTKTAPAAQPVAKPGLPEDVARAVMFLASDNAAFVTGTHLLIDGGMLVGQRHSWDPNFQRPADHPLTRFAATQAAAEDPA